MPNSLVIDVVEAMLESLFAQTPAGYLYQRVDIPPRIVPAIVEFIFGDLAASPRRVGKPLQRELAGAYSARRGPYGVLYDIEDDPPQVVILHIDHRGGVYRSL